MWSVFARVAQAEKEILKSRPLDYYFPFVGGNFPYNGDAPDITISSNTVWDDFIGFKQVGKLTINAGVTLKIEQSPFIIFADEIVFGGTNSIIDGNGPSGAASGSHPIWCARGGTATDGGARAQAGCGGILLLVVANTISGANGIIRANGGDGWVLNVVNDSYESQGGQGALSTLPPAVTTGDYPAQVCAFGSLLSNGGHVGNAHGGTGGGSGRSYNAGASSYRPYAGGGSGIGGGGAAGYNSAPGSAFAGKPNLPGFLLLISYRCLGGGGGGAAVSRESSGTNAGGGGGGGIGLLVKDLSATPVLEANGGKGKKYSSSVAGGVDNSADGGAGVTFIEDVSLWGVEL